MEKVTVISRPVTRLRKGLEQRFARERDILAGLEHPNIARLYDAGIDADGLPYLAMEFVQGKPLTAWCDAHLLGIAERLKLFLQVLDAVQYAHERHVVHRDIKPSNILATEAGQVRLLDFGVAKLLEEDSDQPELTRIYGQALTPGYASPELLRGDPVDAHSDIYSLGVILYELLCGARPYRIKPGATLEALAHAVRSREVKQPSRHIGPGAGPARATTQEKLARDLRGDLDAIALKTLAKDTVDRYPSAKALSDDLQRYLHGEPVKAQRPRLSYRLRKFVLRHPVAVAVSAAMLVLIAVGYEVIRGEIERAKAEAIATAASANVGAPIVEKSVAVLPFADLSEKHDQEYFSDGLSEELIDRLSSTRDLKVIARTSSFSFKGKNVDTPTIAAKLGVAHLLEGSVRKSGNALRVTVQLIKAKDSAVLWSQTYDRSLDDVFRVQDEIAGNVTAQLKAALNAGAPTSREPPMPAYNLVLKGNFHLDRNTKGDVEKAVALYRESIKIDSRYAPAWVGLARACVRQADLGWRPSKEALSEARTHIRRALYIDPNLPIAHFIQGEIHLLYDWDWAAAASDVDRMHALGGSDPLYELRLRALIAWMFGRFDDAISDYRQVLDHDPLNRTVWTNLAVAFMHAGDLERAASAYREVLQISPMSATTYSDLASVLLLSGRLPEALEAAQKESDDDARHSALGSVYWAMGRQAEAEAELDKVQDSYDIAQKYAFRSDKDAAFRWLDRAYTERNSSMVMVKVDPYLRNLHGDPRYQALLAKMKLDRDPPGRGR